MKRCIALVWLLAAATLALAQDEPTIEFVDLKFFEGSRGVQDPKKARVSATFNKTGTRCIYALLGVRNLKVDQGENRVTIEFKYFAPDTTLFARVSSEFKILSDWKIGDVWHGWGWDEPGHWKAGNWKVEAWYRNQKFGEGFFTVEDDRPEPERRADAVFDEAERFYRRKDYDRALLEYARVLQINPKHAGALLGSGACRYELGDYAGAQDDFTKYIEGRPKEAEAYNWRGRARTERRDWDGAMEDYDKALELDPAEGSYYNNRGVVHYRKGELDAAIEQFSKGIERGHTFALSGRADAYEKKGLLEEALEDRSKLIERTPKDPHAWAGRAGILHVLGRLQAAFEDCSKAIELDPAYSWGYGLRGYVSYDRRRFAEAVADFRKAAEPGGDAAYYAFRIWLARARLGEAVDATKELAERLHALKLEPWPGRIGEFLLGKISQEELVKAAENSDEKLDREQKCEAYFYAGTRRLIDGDQEGAATLFRKCLDQGVTEFLEHKSARFELEPAAEK